MASSDSAITSSFVAKVWGRHAPALHPPPRQSCPHPPQFLGSADASIPTHDASTPPSPPALESPPLSAEPPPSGVSIVASAIGGPLSSGAPWPGSSSPHCKSPTTPSPNGANARAPQRRDMALAYHRASG